MNGNVKYIVSSLVWTQRYCMRSAQVHDVSLAHALCHVRHHVGQL